MAVALKKKGVCGRWLSMNLASLAPTLPLPLRRRASAASRKGRGETLTSNTFRMLSRVADSIYWLSRYVERAENVARFIEVNLQLMLDAASGADQQWEPLVNTTGDHEAFSKRHEQATQQKVIHFLTFDAENPNSIL